MKLYVHTLVCCLASVAFISAGCKNEASESKKSAAEKTLKVPTDETEARKLIKIEDLEAGSGPSAEKNDLLLVEYRGTLLDGTEFDSNDKEGKNPFTLRLGQGEVIRGWDLGLVGMKVGSRRKLTIPPQLAYGDSAQEKIPANSTLVFDVKLLDIVKVGEEGEYDSNDLKKGTGKQAKVGSTVTIHYVGKLVNGKEFDSSRARNEPFTFKIGEHSVIPGMEHGVVDMKEGGIRKLRIPPAIAYGPSENGPIPGNSVLIFEIELLKVK